MAKLKESAMERYNRLFRERRAKRLADACGAVEAYRLTRAELLAAGVSPPGRRAATREPRRLPGQASLMADEVHRR